MPERQHEHDPARAIDEVNRQTEQVMNKFHEQVIQESHIEPVNLREWFQLAERGELSSFQIERLRRLSAEMPPDMRATVDRLLKEQNRDQASSRIAADREGP